MNLPDGFRAKVYREGLTGFVEVRDHRLQLLYDEVFVAAEFALDPQDLQEVKRKLDGALMEAELMTWQLVKLDEILSKGMEAWSKDAEAQS